MKYTLLLLIPKYIFRYSFEYTLLTCFVEFAPISIAGELKDQGKANTMVHVAPGLHIVGMHAAGGVVSIAIQDNCDQQAYTDMSTAPNLRGLSWICIFGFLFKMIWGS